MGNLPIAMQVYSVRELAANDFCGTMKMIKSFGYDGVELAGMYDLTANEIKECLLEIGLEPISAHVPIEALMEDLEGTVSAYKTIGCKYIAIPYLDETKRYGQSGYEEVLSSISQISKVVKNNGMELLYHNHDFEFEMTNEGEYALDALFNTFTKDELATEIDTCWVKVAGVDPVEYVSKYAGRCPLVHLKDFTDSDPVMLAPLGTGKQDVMAIMNAAVSSGAKWIVIEQDDHPTGSPMENMKQSIEYLKGEQ